MKNPSQDFIDLICRLYGDCYNDEEEDSAPGGLDWFPGKKAQHKSLAAFQRELEEQGIRLSTGKIRKILITGSLWSTESSREVGMMYEEFTTPVAEGGPGLSPGAARKRIAEETGYSSGMVTMLLPYDRVVYGVPGKTSNAARCDRARRKRKTKQTIDKQQQTT